MKKETIIFKSSRRNSAFLSESEYQRISYSKQIILPPCEWDTLEYSSTSHCTENTHPPAFSVFSYSLELLFCILGAQKGWDTVRAAFSSQSYRVCHGNLGWPRAIQLPADSGTWTILKVSHFQVLMVMMKMRRPEFSKENKSRIWSYWALFRISISL